MKQELTLEKIKEIEIAILDYVDKVCSEHQIPYILHAGTLLGAVRHQGFIPWDDDIDIALFRKDYIRLIEVLKQQKSKYKILSSNTNKDYFYTFAKLVDTSTQLIEEGCQGVQGLGVYIDIFPLDNLPEDEQIRKKWQSSLEFMTRIWGNSIQNNEAIKKADLRHKIQYIMGKLIGARTIVHKINQKATMYMEKEAVYVNDVCGCNNFFRNMPKKWIENITYVNFEGKKYPAPQNYEEYLTLMYGDYRQLPPKEKQVTHHNFKAYKKG